MLILDLYFLHICWSISLLTLEGGTYPHVSSKFLGVGKSNYWMVFFGKICFEDGLIKMHHYRKNWTSSEKLFICWIDINIKDEIELQWHRECPHVRVDQMHVLISLSTEWHVVNSWNCKKMGKLPMPKHHPEVW